MRNWHNPRAMAFKRWSIVLQLQVGGHIPEKYLPIHLFDIHIRLYKCLKIWMVKIWQIFSQSSFLPYFSGANVSLHTIYLEKYLKHYHRWGKICWAKYSRFQYHQSFYVNIFVLPWPQAVHKYSLFSIIQGRHLYLWETFVVLPKTVNNAKV